MHHVITTLGILLIVLVCFAPIDLIRATGDTKAVRDHADPDQLIDRVLTEFHDAASKADFDRYFGHFTENAVFFGTDPSERWTIGEFKDFAKPYFDAGQGWTYEMRERNIFVNLEESAACFDEVIENAKYGRCRGTGAMTRSAQGQWKIEQYNLVIPVPNDFAMHVVRATTRGVTTPRTIYVVRHAEKHTGAEHGQDPELTEAGRERAERLGAMLRDIEVETIYSSNYRRTRQTAAPLAALAGIEPVMYDASDSQDLAEIILDSEANEVFVVGHSNTVPGILEALGVKDEVTIEDDEYDHLFIVYVDSIGRAVLHRLHY